MVKLCNNHQARWPAPLKGSPGAASPEKRQVARARGLKARVMISAAVAKESHSRQCRVKLKSSHKPRAGSRKPV